MTADSTLPGLAPQGLPALEARLRQDLQWLALPGKSWVPPRQADGHDALPVAIIGGGMAGLALAAALKLQGMPAVCFDPSPPGFEGPWATTARMGLTLSGRPPSRGGPAQRGLAVTGCGPVPSR